MSGTTTELASQALLLQVAVFAPAAAGYARIALWFRNEPQQPRVGAEGGGKTYTTYTRTNNEGTVYSGRTSGKGTAEQQVATRTGRADHQAKTAEGYGPAKVDKNSANPDAIRGREQQLIEQNGGAQSAGGTSGNKINGVSPNNAKGDLYRAACKKEFGC